MVYCRFDFGWIIDITRSYKLAAFYCPFSGYAFRKDFTLNAGSTDILIVLCYSLSPYIAILDRLVLCRQVLCIFCVIERQKLVDDLIEGVPKFTQEVILFENGSL